MMLYDVGGERGGGGTVIMILSNHIITCVSIFTEKEGVKVKTRGRVFRIVIEALSCIVVLIVVAAAGWVRVNLKRQMFVSGRRLHPGNKVKRASRQTKNAPPPSKNRQ